MSYPNFIAQVEVLARNYRENLLGHRFACLLLDLHLIFCGHGFHASCRRELIYKEGDGGHAHHQSLNCGGSADAFGELYWLPD